MSYHLLGDQEAKKAFYGDNSEMTHSPNWVDVMQANMTEDKGG
jgi:hypothetical protein